MNAAYQEAKIQLLHSIEGRVKDNTDVFQNQSNNINSLSTSTATNIMEEQVRSLNEQVLRLQQMLITNQANQVDQTAAHRPLVPRISLPRFSGNLSEWTQFHDLFMSLIGNNTQLSGSEKMHHLKSSLTGEAELLLRPFTISDANYDEAWEMLSQRFDNKRLIIGKYLDNVLDIPNIRNQDFKQLRKLIDITNESIRSLRVLKQPVDNWDTIFVHILTKKLDSDSRRQWELHLERDKNESTFKNLITFLETLCRAFEASANSKAAPVFTTPSFNSTRKPIAAHSHHSSTSSDVCTMCQGPHSIKACSKFSEMPESERREFVADKRLCFNCMSAHHMSRDCQSEHSCKKCKRKHNTLLHYSGNTTSFTSSEHI